jgi:hypothetical protein
LTVEEIETQTLWRWFDSAQIGSVTISAHIGRDLLTRSAKLPLDTCISLDLRYTFTSMLHDRVVRWPPIQRLKMRPCSRQQKWITGGFVLGIQLIG